MKCKEVLNIDFWKNKVFQLFKTIKEMPKEERRVLLKKFLLVFLSTFGLCICSLLIAYGPAYPDSVFFGYFKNPLIIILNYAPILAFFLLLYGIIGKTWIAYLTESFVVMSLAIANFFMLKFRDDTLLFSDILHFREAVKISSEGYKYEITLKMWLCFAICVAFTLVLGYFYKSSPNKNTRCALVVLVLVLSLIFGGVFFSTNIYDNHTDNYDELVRWSPTQSYVSKGFVYPFIHSVSAVLDAKPDGYNKGDAKEILDAYEEKTIDNYEKVNVIGIMLEAFCDVGTLGIDGISENVYDCYRRLKQENLSGTLVTNIFAAGTIDSERAFLTGYPDIADYRQNINSHVRYFTSQGYCADGSHPSENWFYNRRNSNEYLGFETYRFAENHFLEKYGNMMRLDHVVIDDFYDSYINHIENSNKPYFGFHVTYQGHGPYETDAKYWGTDENPLYVGKNVSEETDCILNNYFGSVKDTGWRILQFVEKIKGLDEPTVVVIFGDHKPWLGDGNSVYNELDINLDVSTKEGFLNYYSTEYIIAANDSAKAILENDFTGTGPMTSPCFLMNLLFDNLGYEGSAYMQFTDSVMERLPVINSAGVIDSDGNFYTIGELEGELLELYKKFKNTAYYESTEFRY